MPDDQMKWRLPETLTLTRSDGCQILINITQDGNTLVGTAHASAEGGATEITGAMSGSVQGDAISLTVYWPDKSVADFNGTVGSSGLASGTTALRPNEALPGDWSAAPAAWAWE